MTPDPEDRDCCTICANEVKVGIWYDVDQDEIPDDWGILLCGPCYIWAGLVEIGNAWG